MMIWDEIIDDDADFGIIVAYWDQALNYVTGIKSKWERAMLLILRSLLHSGSIQILREKNMIVKNGGLKHVTGITLGISIIKSII